MEIFIIWIAFSAFSIGLCENDTKGWEGIAKTVAYLLLWPLILGGYLREKAKDMVIYYKTHWDDKDGADNV